MKKRLLGVITMIIIIGLVYAFYQYNRTPMGVAKIAPAHSLTSDELYTAFSNDEDKANLNYKGKVIEVSGKVEEININGETTTIVLTAPDYPIGGVSCTMEKTSESIQVGDIVQIKGECQGVLMQVILNKAIILK